METFYASRWTRGNRIFRTGISVGPKTVTHIKRRLFGREENTMSIAHIASVNISSGIIWADVHIESSGGSRPVHSHGHKKRDARRIRELIERYQQELKAEKGGGE